MTQEDIADIVRDFEDRYVDAFNRRDASALISLFTENVTIVTEWGDVVAGRVAFAQGLERAFAVVARDIRIENTPSHTLALTEDVIISHGRSRKLFSESGEEEQLVYTRVLMRKEGKWQLAANHVAQPTVQADPRSMHRGDETVNAGGEI
jgi:uncharacterized protein (TIGR02246 family)